MHRCLLLRSLLGVKRTWRLHCEMTAMTKSEHHRALSISLLEPLRSPETGGGNETARVHHTSWRRGCLLAARGGRAVRRPDATGWRADGLCRERSGLTVPSSGISG